MTVPETARSVGRAVAGLFAGAVFGLFAALLFGWMPEQEPKTPLRFPVVAPLVGAIFLAVAAVLVDHKPLPDRFSRIAKGVLGGGVVGLLVGAFVYGPWMAALDADPVFYSKAEGIYRNQGVLFGLPLGASMGLIVVIATMVFQRRRGIEVAGVQAHTP